MESFESDGLASQDLEEECCICNDLEWGRVGRKLASWFRCGTSNLVTGGRPPFTWGVN